jgi:hypothetical protein
LPEWRRSPEQRVHLLQGRVRPQGAVVHQAGAPPLSSSPCQEGGGSDHMDDSNNDGDVDDLDDDIEQREEGV